MELTAGKVDFVIARAFHVNSPAMRFDNSFCKRQPQACTAAFEAGLAGRVLAQFTGLIEFCEDDLAEIRVYTDACVSDDDLKTAVGQVNDRGDAVPGDGDLSIIGREFDRVADQVME